MCIMEVRAGQQDSTIAQAMAHNTATVVGDLEMFATVLRARVSHETGDQRLDTEAALAEVARAHTQLRTAYAGLLGLFGAEVGRHAEHWLTNETHGHAHTGPAPIFGNERLDGLIIPAELGGRHSDSHEHASAEPVPVTSLVVVADADRKRARKYETR